MQSPEKMSSLPFLAFVFPHPRLDHQLGEAETPQGPPKAPVCPQVYIIQRGTQNQILIVLNNVVILYSAQKKYLPPL